MSFSNADTGNKPADPYTAKNKEETSVKEKVEDLSAFVDACKFGMMTTKDSSTGNLVSRCMAVAAKVCTSLSIRIYNLVASLIVASLATSVTNLGRAKLIIP